MYRTLEQREEIEQLQHRFASPKDGEDTEEDDSDDDDEEETTIPRVAKELTRHLLLTEKDGVWH